MPRWMNNALVLTFAASLIPLAWVARSRMVPSDRPRHHLFQDMDNQSRYDAQQPNLQFADRRAMRPPVEGTVARGQLREDDHLYRGITGESFAESNALPVTHDLFERGRDRYGVFCTPCHGISGYGGGMVARRAESLQMPNWVPPTSLHDELVLSRPDGQLFSTITNGIRTMPAYGASIPVEDRWAIVGYVRALQRSQRASIEDVPQAERPNILEEAVP
jgi:mono/diheme cytochrome c family protein